MPAARENEIGRCRCPVCQSTRARLRVSNKQLAYVMCNTCNVQVFARSDRSDELLRPLLLSDDVPAPDPAPAALPKPVATILPPPTVHPTVKPATSWGIFR